MNAIMRSFSKRFLFHTVILTVVALLLIAAGVASTASAEQAADVAVGASGIIVTPTAPGVTFMMLRVASPEGQVIFDKSSSGGPITWSPAEGAQGGLYTYEVRVGFSARNKTRDDAPQPAPHARPWRHSGTVFIKGGVIVPPSFEETGLLEDLFSVTSAAFAKLVDFLIPPAYADVLHYDDVIITGSLGVGFDCVDGENFGFDTLKLKENNLRLFFEDTSTTVDFPANDWRIVINDTANGGANYFAVEDSTGGTVPFKIEAGAPTDSLYIEDYGRIGIGTALPYVEVHIADGDTPTVRFEQDGSSGWSPQTWDVAGNESNFFIRDVTNGSKLPFRIQPGAPADSLCMKSDGNVGIGTWSPAAPLELETTDEDAEILLERKDDGATGVGATGFVSAKAASVAMGSTTAHPLDFVVNNVSAMTIDTGGKIGIGTAAPSVALHVVGNAFVSGNLEVGSSRDLKENIQPIHAEEAMDALKELRPVRFNYKINPDEESVGFIAEEVPDLVATQSRKTLSPVDVVAVLAKVAQEQQKVIEELSRKVVDLERELKERPRSASPDKTL